MRPDAGRRRVCRAVGALSVAGLAGLGWAAHGQGTAQNTTQNIGQNTGPGVGAAARVAGTGAPSAPRLRIVSVGAAITETLYALGAQSDLVGVDTSSQWPVEAMRLPQVGYQRTLSPEGLLALRPTLVLATETAGPPAVLQQLREAGITLQVIDADHRIEGVRARTQRVAEACGRAEAGRALSGRIAADWQRALARAGQLRRAQAGAEPPPLRVLFVMTQGGTGLRAAGRDTAPDALLAYAGARNVMAAVEGYQAVSAEAMVAAAPQVIVSTTHTLQAAGGPSGLLAQAGLALTPAGRAGRVVALDTLLALGFGPRLPLALQTLAEGLYGGAGGRA
ncbi:MAG: hypothetical protein RLY78_2646 [Pseudomonadota bacterium]